MYLLLALAALLAVSAAEQESRVVGGVDAQPEYWTWQVSLQFWSDSTQSFRHICGGSLINQYWVLTAAHCIDHDMTISKYQLVFGEWDLSHDKGDEQRIAPEKFVKHSGYTGTGGYNNDIALIRLSKPVVLGQNVHLAHLTTNPSEPYTGRTCYITGWGLTEGGGSTLPNILQEARVNVITHSTCRSALGLTGLLYLSSTAHICIQYEKTAACNGDSGGPLVCLVEGSGAAVGSHHDWQLAGVTSWGLSGCPAGQPSVYVRLTSYLDWITTQTNVL
ncbi:hypothetical protein CHS0354_013155 [Potamilus streckersoni]|uniref:Peptidase S1 domain-containing protein n=1 Tax=Potamilus streckersoni TaxID=2493646 RepID=A0AAE0T802_9BIVA|nr:hypothetical protein CHS0354_013155 [Potamilus streckersoni]